MVPGDSVLWTLACESPLSPTAFTTSLKYSLWVHGYGGKQGQQASNYSTANILYSKFPHHFHSSRDPNNIPEPVALGHTDPGRQTSPSGLNLSPGQKRRLGLLPLGIKGLCGCLMIESQPSLSHLPEYPTRDKFIYSYCYPGAVHIELSWWECYRAFEK